MFYKKEENEILNGGDTVSTPSVVLTASAKDEFTYPQEGWYWFDTFDEALVFFAGNVGTSNVISKLQAMKYLKLPAVNKWEEFKVILASNDGINDEWLLSSELNRSYPLVTQMGAALGIDEAELDVMFVEASKL